MRHKCLPAEDLVHEVHKVVLELWAVNTRVESSAHAGKQGDAALAAWIGARHDRSTPCTTATLATKDPTWKWVLAGVALVFQTDD